jgi:hypothetical protein
MFGKPSSRWIRLAFKGTLPALLLILIATQALAAPLCKKVNGKFTLQAFPAPECTSAVSICANGDFSGDLAGHSVFIGSSLIQSVDTPTTGVVFLTGDATLTTDNGVVLTKDAISLSTTGHGEFGEVISIIGGTGRWAGSLGKVTATGTFLNGSGAGTYNGEVCAP